MANPEHLAILKRGVVAWNMWRKEKVSKDSTTPDLRGVDLTRAYLRGANLQQADLKAAVLDGTTLTRANLRSANLRDANLKRAIFRTADLSNADVTGAHFYETILADARLIGVQGLNSCTHHGPSVIDHRTLLRSSLPITFLKGCGLPDQLITYLRTLRQTIQFYSCFISYSTKDQDFADRLHADLQAKGVRCWFAPHDIKGGRKIHEQIDEAIRVYDKLLLVLSDASMNSNWVKTEIANAREREEKQKQQMLFPITLAPFEQIKKWKCFDADTGIDSAREIREYFVPDFSHWKDHDSYRAAFDRLMRDLQAKPHTQ